MRTKTILATIQFNQSATTETKLHHNFIKLYMELNGNTPSLRAGIEIKGDNKWKTIIENALKTSDT